jgi:hypothetical protein
MSVNPPVFSAAEGTKRKNIHIEQKEPNMSESMQSLSNQAKAQLVA